MKIRLPWTSAYEDMVQRIAELEKEVVHWREARRLAIAGGDLLKERIAALESLCAKHMDEIQRVTEENERLRAALKQIAEKHQAYDQNESGQYGIGVTDGHRCAANTARAALAGRK